MDQVGPGHWTVDTNEWSYHAAPLMHLQCANVQLHGPSQAFCWSSCKPQICKNALWKCINSLFWQLHRCNWRGVRCGYVGWMLIVECWMLTPTVAALAASDENFLWAPELSPTTASTLLKGLLTITASLASRATSWKGPVSQKATCQKVCFISQDCFFSKGEARLFWQAFLKIFLISVFFRAPLQCGDWWTFFSRVSLLLASVMALPTLIAINYGQRGRSNIKRILSILLLLLPSQSEAGCPFQNPFWFLDRWVLGEVCWRFFCLPGNQWIFIYTPGPPWWRWWTARVRWSRTGFAWAGEGSRTSSVSTTSRLSTTRKTTG